MASSSRLNRQTIACGRALVLISIVLAAVLCGPTACSVAQEQPTSATPDDIAFFEARIRPVLVRHCYECHSSATADPGGSLLLDFRGGVLNGGDSGPAIDAGDPDSSLLLEALRFESLEMPPTGQLPDHVIRDFEEWIRRGLPDPRATAPSPTEAAEAAWTVQLEERRSWWSLQPLSVVEPPVVDDDQWSEDPVDRFVLDSLQQSDLTPAPPADAETLLRRMSLILTGLPPEPQRVLEFPQQYTDDPEAALNELMTSLLDSPHFGERFARHWMDVVRYTDTYGYEWDNPARGSWEYRDYLIRAFNEDVGFDQLIREQLAGDLLPEPRISDQEGLNESLIGPMFFHLGEHRHGSSLDFNGIHQDMVDNKIDAFSKAFLGMTVACARCHDHKLDAISQADYYALAGVFMSPRWTSRVIDRPGRYTTPITQLKKQRDNIQQQLAAWWLDVTGPQSSVAPLTGSSLHAWADSRQQQLQKAAPESIGRVLHQILTADSPSIESVWTALAAQWRTDHQTRRESNVKNFTPLVDLSEPGLPEGWSMEGDGIRHGFVHQGTALISLNGDTLVNELLAQGYHTHALSSRLPGAVKIPPLGSIDRQHLSLRVRGSEWAGHLVIPGNAFQSEFVTFLQPGDPAGKWMLVPDRALKNGVTRVFSELITASLNPNFPPRTGLARAGDVKLPNDDTGFNKRSWFSLTGIAAHDITAVPQDERQAFVGLFDAASAPATVETAWEQIASWLQASLRRWSDGNATAGDVQVLNWMLQEGLLPNQQTAAPELATAVQHYRETESQIAFPRTVNGMDERNTQPLNYRLNIRGNVDDEGPEVPRGFLTVFNAQNSVDLSPHSGRLELAEYLAGGQNAQAARVYVNRVWQWVFGTGLVATPNDFGKLGDRPSHPELLDWLAADLIADGWSTKRLLRRLLLSQTFRQSGIHSQQARDLDPDNRLLHHYSTRRLEAEAIRDCMLQVSGQLDPALYGPPINPPRTVEDGSKRLFSGPVDGHGRRSLYLQMSIMDPPKFLVAFNLPDLKLPTGRRDVTNVPTQALALLNDPLVVQLANAWGNHLVQDGLTTPEDRVQSMFVRATGRRPRPEEVQRWTDALRSFSEADDPQNDVQAWSNLAHAFFNMKEFIYYR